jgi:hypothetical protein
MSESGRGEAKRIGVTAKEEQIKEIGVDMSRQR